MKLLKPENVQILHGAADWKDAIRRSTSLLEEHGDEEPCYKEEIIGNVERLGPYILIAEDIALPHARPEQGVIHPQIGVTLFRNPVCFSNGATAKLFVTLAAKDNESHVDALAAISELLGEEENVEKIITAPDVETLYSYFSA
jgi:PTS system ascorbate-specific IIA component